MTGAVKFIVIDNKPEGPTKIFNHLVAMMRRILASDTKPSAEAYVPVQDEFRKCLDVGNNWHLEYKPHGPEDGIILFGDITYDYHFVLSYRYNIGNPKPTRIMLEFLDTVMGTPVRIID